MYTLFLVCTTIGGTILLLQVALSLLGIGFETAGGHIGDIGGGHIGDIGGHVGDVGGGHVGDVGGGHADMGGHAADHSGDVGDSSGHGEHSGLSRLGRMLTFQTVLAFVTFFGVGGLASLESGREPLLAVPLALATGIAAMFLIGWCFQALGKLQGDGTVRLERAVGARGRVYLRIPGNDSGAGKVTLVLQDRTIEVQARTQGPELRTGEEVVVTRVIDTNTVEVVAAAAHVEKPVPLYE